ncbi:HU family DNA-binding protein [Oceanotoga sp. DSM 15011]|jgi:DNA-binding protein HU-beta|uniref:DNA-binding protein HU-beta n=1 Tax=Oceanotoga teriensis TaxID=515440 RepID=A0AA45C4L1_9BACT|nr:MULTISPECIES: HU family DNA-binding protein [Oceanotoga]MDN5343585.1 DNA-binding protein HU-beta [Oceanotoga sp.]MDO7977314.1 HU family DNA-binding protein [Oceanotoga teriensis]PWJ86733.1 DNA-binding protein HU-beta [Oceanotoga teriensis]UYP00467.1 HU family DNA-binding protein [Oceanotoga sp. DSM 15011]
MNKKELVDALSEKASTTKKQAEVFVDSFVSVVSEELEKEGEVKLVGFGTFKVQQRAARKGVNPQTGKQIKIPARKVPKFIAGKELKERVK